MKGYIIWIPMISSDDFETAFLQANQLYDKRIQHYWNPDRSIGLFFSKLLGLNSPVAWDIYMLFKSNMPQKINLLPHPDFWMHQLDIENQSNHLVLENLRTKIIELQASI